MNRVLREEKKFLISIDEFISLSHKLENIMLSDPHNGTHGYTIRSLYFDTVYDRDCFEKQAGVELRRKIRLRCYDPKADYAMLEIKQKQGANQLKRSLKLKREDAVRLTLGDYSPLLSYSEPFAAECCFILNAFIKSSSISSTGLPLSRNNDLASFKHLISNRHSNSDNSKKRFCSFIAKSSFASTLYRKRGLFENVRLKLNMIVRFRYVN